MKLVGTTTMKTEDGDVVLTSTKDVGAAPLVNALHMFVSSLANDVQMQPGKFKGLTVAVED